MEEGTSKAKRSRPEWLVATMRIVKTLRVPLMCLAAVLIGLWVGYVKLGDRATSELFQLHTWKHLFDLVFSGLE